MSDKEGNKYLTGKAKNSVEPEQPSLVDRVRKNIYLKLQRNEEATAKAEGRVYNKKTPYVKPK